MRGCGGVAGRVPPGQEARAGMAWGRGGHAEGTRGGRGTRGLPPPQLTPLVGLLG